MVFFALIWKLMKNFVTDKHLNDRFRVIRANN